MAAPNMAAIAASLERSLQNCSLNHQQSSSSSGGGGAAAQGPDSPPEAAAPTLELNSEGALPFHWEQCLDLKTGEIYYINWRTGMKAKEDPRSTADYGGCGGEYYSEDDNSSYDSEGSSSSSESCPSSSREQWSGNNDQGNYYFQENNENEDKNNNNNSSSNNNVLVVAGCKSCLMYYMVPKQLEVCPKCCGQLLHFDRSENGSN